MPVVFSLVRLFNHTSGVLLCGSSATYYLCQSKRPSVSSRLYDLISGCILLRFHGKYGQGTALNYRGSSALSRHHCVAATHLDQIQTSPSGAGADLDHFSPPRWSADAKGSSACAPLDLGTELGFRSDIQCMLRRISQAQDSRGRFSIASVSGELPFCLAAQGSSYIQYVYISSTYHSGIVSQPRVVYSFGWKERADLLIDRSGASRT